MLPKNNLIQGIGVNDSEYAVRIFRNTDGKKVLMWSCPYYQSWKSMIERCYSKALHIRYPTYIGCSVTSDWLIFSNFRKWMIGQNWQGMELDKDILFKGNKIYSPDTCVFVSVSLNTFLNDCNKLRGEWPIGVSWDKAVGKFQVRCSNPFSGKLESLGKFNCPNKAHEAWQRRKHQHACAYADMQTDKRIADALRSRYLPGKEFD